MTPLNYADFRSAWLEDVQEGQPSTTELGHRFAQKLLTQWLDLDANALASDDFVPCDGAGDGGIDIAYLQRAAERAGEEDVPEGDTWYLVQSKYGTAFGGTSTLLTEAQKVIDTLAGHRQNLSSLATSLVSRLQQFRKQAGPDDRIRLVFATVDPLSDNERRVLDTSVRAIGQATLGSLFDAEAVSVHTVYARQQNVPADADRLKVLLSADLVASGDKLLVGSIPLLELYGFLKRYKQATEDLDALYEKNVRRFLGGRRKVNKQMRDTLYASPERFGLYNNGITIVVTDFEQRDGHVHLVEPYVVNGCQTTRTVWEVCRDRLEAGGTGTDPELVAWRDRLAQGVVVAKIVQVGGDGDDLLRAITRYTNSQNAVQAKDFIALNDDFRTWKQAFEDQYDVFLEIQRGGWDSQRAQQKANPSAHRFLQAANAFDLLKVYGAGWLREPGWAYGRNAAFLPGGTVFNRIMRDGSVNAEDLYAAFLLHKAAEAYGFGRGSEHLSRRQTRFLFYTVTLDILRDVLISTGEESPTPASLTQALLRLAHTDAFRTLTDTAIGVVDEYLTRGKEDSVFQEPPFQDRFNNDLNAFLKWEGLGKETEHLQSLVKLHQRLLARAAGSEPAPIEHIKSAMAPVLEG